MWRSAPPRSPRASWPGTWPPDTCCSAGGRRSHPWRSSSSSGRPTTAARPFATTLPRLANALDFARAGRRTAAFLLLDLDRFKLVNDTYLYEAGDEVLIVTARRLLGAVRALDTVARMNRAGDEFAILLDGVPDIDTAMRLAHRVQDRIREPIRLRSVSGAVVDVDASIGVVFLERGTTLWPATVVDIADARMMTAKGLKSGIVVEGQNDEAALERRRAAGPRRVEHGAAPALLAGRRSTDQPDLSPAEAVLGAMTEGGAPSDV
jgi:diguanylate cyclase (GGDEF)-like protein